MTTSLRRSFEHSAVVPAPPEAVFPLLCPVREYDWIEGWSCELLHTVSGVAEKGAIFRTAAPSGTGTMTWVITVYDPPRRIEFSCVAEGGAVMRLEIGLRPTGLGTEVDWRREYTATSPESAAWLETVDEKEVATRTRVLFDRLTHYLQTGTMLRASC
jgi:hypothetical protein